MTNITECEILYCPETEELRFLPEGPMSLGENRVSWVAIAHGPTSTQGSLNILDTSAKVNHSYLLPGRPGFAFPTTQSNVFVCGVDRQLGLYDVQHQQWTEFATGVDESVENTIINDGIVVDGNLVFGCKDLEFKTPKAGLYLWRAADQNLIQLRNDQICSNGKAILRDADGSSWLLDIDSPTKTVTRARLDIANGCLETPAVALDLTDEASFPDGMILTPDGSGVIIAFYDPGDPLYGVARQYDLTSRQIVHEWRCPGSPRVTCPQLAQIDGSVRLILTTAVEHMEPEQHQRYPHAGCLFFGETEFTSIGDQTPFPISHLSGN